MFLDGQIWFRLILEPSGMITGKILPVKVFAIRIVHS